MPNHQFEVIAGGQDGSDSEAEKANRAEENRVKGERILSDAELIKGGAKFGENGDLELQEGQIVGIRESFNILEKTIARLERPELEEGLKNLREKGKAVAREMRELYLAARDLNMSRRVITEAALRREPIDPYEEEFRRDEKRFNDSSKQVEPYLLEVRDFAEQHGLERLGALDLSGGADRRKSDLIEAVANGFESPEQLVDAIEQVRDARLKRAHADKKKFIGKAA